MCVGVRHDDIEDEVIQEGERVERRRAPPGPEQGRQAAPGACRAHIPAKRHAIRLCGVILRVSLEFAGRRDAPPTGQPSPRSARHKKLEMMRHEKLGSAQRKTLKIAQLVKLDVLQRRA